jgi:hypothetical protein
VDDFGGKFANEKKIALLFLKLGNAQNHSFKYANLRPGLGRSFLSQTFSPCF